MNKKEIIKIIRQEKENDNNYHYYKISKDIRDLFKQEGEYCDLQFISVYGEELQLSFLEYEIYVKPDKLEEILLKELF